MSISSKFRMEEWKTRRLERGFPDRSSDRGWIAEDRPTTVTINRI